MCSDLHSVSLAAEQSKCCLQGRAAWGWKVGRALKAPPPSLSASAYLSPAP